MTTAEVSPAALFGFSQSKLPFDINFFPPNRRQVIVRTITDTWTLDCANKVEILDPLDPDHCILRTIWSIGKQPIIIPEYARLIRIHGDDPRSPMLLEIIKA